MRRARRPALPGSPPAADTGELHVHPLPRFVRVALVLYGLLLLVFGAAVLTIALVGPARVQSQVMAELDRRSAARDAETAATRAETRDAVCALLPDIPTPSEKAQRVADALGCPVLSPQPAPAPSSTRPPAVPAERGTPPASRPPAAPAPRPAESRKPTRSPNPAPSPEPSPEPSTCLPVLGVCLP